MDYLDNLQQLPQGLWGLPHPWRYSYLTFRLLEEDGYSKILIGYLWKEYD